jgi:hypothetical protein
VEYDEDAVLTQYVWDYYQMLMTDFERRVGFAILGRMKAADTGNPQVARLLKERWGAVSDPEVEAALAEGEEAFRRRVRQRLFSEHGDDIFINHFPRCRRVVRTPRARQCFWCGWDWHNMNG